MTVSHHVYPASVHCRAILNAGTTERYFHVFVSCEVHGGMSHIISMTHSSYTPPLLGEPATVKPDDSLFSLDVIPDERIDQDIFGSTVSSNLKIITKMDL